MTKNCQWNCVGGYCLSFNAQHDENKCVYCDVQLTDQEKGAAIYEGKVKKFFHERNKAYWETAEGKKEMVRLKKVAKDYGLI